MSDVVTLPAGGQITVTAGSAAADALRSQISYYDGKYSGNAQQVPVGQAGTGSSFAYSITTATGGNALTAGDSVTGLFDNGTGVDTLTGSASTLLITANNSGDVIYSKNQSVADTTIVVGGTGSDTLYADNPFNAAYLGAGANQVFLTGGGSLKMFAGGGSDTVTIGEGGGYVQSDYAVTAVITGSAAQQALTLADNSTIQGGAGSGTGVLYLYGDHQILNEAGSDLGVSMMGAGGVVTISGANDTINAVGSIRLVYSGSGASYLNPADHSTIIGGAGSSSYWAVSGASQAVTEYGSGSKVEMAGVGDTVTLRGTNDTVVGGDTTSPATAFNTRVVIASGGDDVLTLAGPSTIVGGAASTGTLHIDGNKLAISEAGSGIAITLNSSQDTITLTGKNETLTGGSAEIVNISGGGQHSIDLSNSTVRASASNTTLGFDGKSLAITETGSNDSIGLGTSTGDTVTLAGNGETVSSSAAANVAVSKGSGDVLRLGAHSTITSGTGRTGLLTVTGNDQSIAEHAANAALALGKGAGDTVTLFGVSDTMTGTGAVRVTVAAAGASLTLGAGSTVVGSFANGTLADNGSSQLIIVNGDSARISLGTGKGDTVTLAGTHDLLSGTGPARVSVSGSNETVSAGGQSTIIGAAGSGALTVNGNGQNIQEAGSKLVLGIGAATGDTIGLTGSGDTVTSTHAVRVGIANAGNETLRLGDHSTIVGAASSTGKLIVTGNGQTIAQAASHVTMDLSGSSNDTITLGAAAAQDRVTLGGGTNLLTSGLSATVIGGGGTFVFHSRAGGDDSVIAGRGAATMFGGANGRDIFRATLGDAVFRHGAGGSDTFVGGSGSDTMLGAGSSGKDLFVFESSQGGGLHTIDGFMRGRDHIQLSFYDTKAALAHQVDSVKTNSVTLNLDDGTKIHISGVSHLIAGDFVKPNTFG